MDVSRHATADLAPVELAEIRALLDRAFAGEGGFSDEDWLHALGGDHVVIRDAGVILAHGSVVPRRIRLGDAAVDAGYLEAVATDPAHRRRGLGTSVLRALGAIVAERYDVGVLSTGSPAFYSRDGWIPWGGPTFVIRPEGLERTPDEDDGIMVRRTARTPDVPPESPIACEERAGDDW